ncbi:MAG: hypothetical protein C0410_13720 [Anaerolinea sp.]|nr:hypothetical protein [Anaerolinea sp.]
MKGLKIWCLFFVLTLAALAPVFALSEEAETLLKKLKGKAISSQSISENGQTRTVVAEECISTSTIIISEVRSHSEKKIGVGSSKEAVVKILGKPVSTSVYGKRTVLNFKKGCAFIENDKLFNWTGFDGNDSRFYASKICVGCDKEDVIRILGKPIYDGGHYLKYGLSEAINFKDGKVVEWCGFPSDSASFTASIDKPVYSPPTSNVSNHNSGVNGTRPRLSNGNYTIHTGPRGGRYHYSASGKKVYHKKR